MSLRNGRGSPAEAPRDLHVHCATSVPYLDALNASITGVERYAERALLLAEREDVVCTTDEVDPDYLEFLADLGLGPDPDNLVVASRFDDADPCRPLWRRLLESPDALEHLGGLLRGRSSARLHPFIASAGQFQLAAALEERVRIPVRVIGGPANLVTHADHKHHIRAKAVELGVPVAQGEVVDLGPAARGNRGDQARLLGAIERHVSRTGRVIVRGARGAAGSATFVTGPDDAVELAERLAARPENRIYLVESMVDATVSPNVQMRIDPESGSIECLGLTDQRWEKGLVHGGNLFPSAARCTGDMIRWSHTLTKWLKEAGFIGVVGLDFVEYIGPTGAPEAFLAEINPRVNGATYPLGVVQRLNRVQRRRQGRAAAAFVTGMIKTDARGFGPLQELLKDLLFCPETGSGVLPYVTGGLPYGKCGIVAIGGTGPEAAALFGEARSTAERSCVLS